MKKTLLLLLIAALGGGAFWGYRKLFPDDATVIRRRLEQLALAVSFRGDEKPLSQLAHAGSVGGYFTPDVALKISGLDGEGGGIKGRDQIQQLAMSARQQVPSLQIVFLTPEVTVDRATGSAIVQTTVRAQTGNQAEPFLQLLKFDWRKVDGTWLIARVTTVETLRRLPASPEQ